MPNTGDYIKKEREGLDLIIKMKRQNEQKTVPVGELIVFIILPLAIAGGIWKQKEIKEYAQQNEQVSQVIKMVYPEWKSAAELAPPPLPMDQAGLTGEPGQPVSPDQQVMPGTEPGAAPGAAPVDPDQPVSSDPAAASPYASPAPQAVPQSQVSPAYQGPQERGSLLH
jgi:hypothetical protein